MTNDPRTVPNAEHDFPRVAGTTFLKLAALYLLYALYALGHIFAPHVSIPDRLVMTTGSASIVLSLLVPPAAFAAALGRFHLIDETTPGSRRRDWTWLAVMAVGAYLANAFGPVAADLALAEMRASAGLTARPVDIRPVEALVPVATGMFVVMAAVAGALIESTTRWLVAWQRHCVEWTACLGLVACFWFPVMGADALVVRYGTHLSWLYVLGPMAIPTVTAWLLLRRTGYALEDLHPVLGRSRKAQLLDPEAMDRLIAAAVRADGRDAAEVEPVFKNEAEAEMFHFIRRLRAVMAPVVAVSEEETQKVVEAVQAAMSQRPTPAASRSRLLEWQRLLERYRVGEVGVSWAALTAGLLLLGLVGGTSPNVQAAAVLGLVASAASVLFAHHRPYSHPDPALA